MFAGIITGVYQIERRKWQTVQIFDIHRRVDVPDTIFSVKGNAGNRDQRFFVPQGTGQSRQRGLAIAAQDEIHGRIAQYALRKRRGMMAAKYHAGLRTTGFRLPGTFQGHILIG